MGGEERRGTGRQAREASARAGAPRALRARAGGIGRSLVDRLGGIRRLWGTQREELVLIIVPLVAFVAAVALALYLFFVTGRPPK